MSYTYRDISFHLNGKPIFANTLSFTQNTTIENPFEEGDVVSERNITTRPVKTELNFSYYLTGKCPIKDYIYVNEKFPLSGNIAGTTFNFGYIQNYSLNALPHSPVLINASLLICDEITGNLTGIVPSQFPNTKILHFNDSTFNTFGDYSFTSLNNIFGFNWTYNCDVEPIYFYKQTGLNHVNPDRIVLRKKEIVAEITSDDINIPLRFTGDRYALEIKLNHPTNNSIYEIYGISGIINKKDFSISNSNISETVYTIKQSHLNNYPKIGLVDTSQYPTNNYILIDSLNNSNNGFFSEIDNLPLVDRIFLGDDELTFKTAKHASFDRITGYISNKTINGTLQIHTTKNTIVYPAQISLNFSGITLSGFSPETGKNGDAITISGTNFYRITQVLFDNIPAHFQSSKDNTGNIHSIIAAVPSNCRVGKITVLSTLRNVSGTSTGCFYPIMEINSINPKTGKWGDIISISGKNFSGITDVYFNNVKSPSFTVSNLNSITATIPETGQGYTKGFIKLSGHHGMSNISNIIYKPVVSITGLSTISGTSAEDAIIYVTATDSGFLSHVDGTDGGFKVSFGNSTGVFYASGDYALTGLIPYGYLHDQYISLYEPNGVDYYPNFTGKFQQIGPIPEIISIIPETINLYKTYNIKFNGLYFKDFFGLPYYTAISGKNDFYTYPNINANSFQNEIIISGIKITGATGYYDLYVVNYAGSGMLRTGLFVTSGINEARAGIPYQTPESINSTTTASKAIDLNFDSYSLTSSVTAHRQGLWQVTFKSPIDVSIIKVNQNRVPASITIRKTVVGGRNFEYFTYYLIRTGYVEVYGNNNNLLWSTGTTNLSGFIWSEGLSQSITGAKQLRIYSSGTHAANNIFDGGVFGINNVEVY